MHVLDITIMSMNYAPDGATVQGDVQLSLGQTRNATGPIQTVTMACASALSSRVRSDALLVGDALRQLRRMPEVRSGEARLTFAKGLNPLTENRQAA